mgnify:FL=1
MLELFYKYIAYSGNTAVIDEKLPWLDSDEESTVWEHMLKALEYYISPENIGEHGLCKIRGGDWLDPVNLAGLEGRGESVMLTCQVILGLGYMAELCEKLNRDTQKTEEYKKLIPKFKDNLCKHAVNKKGYFNSVFNDDGKWLFSDCDPDGKERPYGPANWYPIACHAVPKDKLDGVFAVMDLLKCEYGYRLYYPAIGEPPIDKVGRCASGDTPAYMAENGNVYNQGSHGYLARALAGAGRGDELFDVMKWMLPCYQEKHPTYAALTAPYVIVNCWQELPSFKHRAMLSFLTGSVAMCVRGAYEWMGGVEPFIGGVDIDPTMPDSWNEMSLSLLYQGKRLNITVKRTGDERLTVNGEEVAKSAPNQNRYNGFYRLPDVMLANSVNEIEITV